MHVLFLLVFTEPRGPGQAGSAAAESRTEEAERERTVSTAPGAGDSETTGGG